MAAHIQTVDGPEPPPVGPLYMNAVLAPHRSLSPRGFGLTMLAVSVISFLSGLYFLSLGAWPVIGFFGLEVAVVWWAFRSNYAAGAREREYVRVCPGSVLVSHQPPKGKLRRWTLSPHFARVELDDPDEPECRLRIRSGRECLQLGDFLSPDERRAFFRALSDAVASARRHRWDDSALSDGVSP